MNKLLVAAIKATLIQIDLSFKCNVLVALWNFVRWKVIVRYNVKV